MKKVVFLFVMYLLLPFTAFAEKTYLFEEFYYAMNREQIKENLNYVSSDKGIDVFSGEMRYINSVDFELYFKFKNKKLVEVFLIKDLSVEPYTIKGLNRGFLFYTRARDYINEFGNLFIYETSLRNYYMSIPPKDRNEAINYKYFTCYGIGRSNFINAKNKSDGTLESFMKKINKDSKMIKLMIFDDLLIISFTRFSDNYTKNSSLYGIVQSLIKASK